MSMSAVGCGTKATKSGTKSSYTSYKLKCCSGATAKLYNNKKLSVSGCSHFKCTTKHGRWSKLNSKTYDLYLDNDSKAALGEVQDSKTLWIEVYSY